MFCIVLRFIQEFITFVIARTYSFINQKSMKTRIIFSLFFMMFGPWVFSQTLLNEDFSGGSMPPAGWTFDAHSTNWSNSSTAQAGGIPPEAKMTWSPQFSGFTRLISPEINTTGHTSLVLSFNHFVDDYSGGYSVGVATRQGTTGTWNIVWQQAVTGNVGPEYKVISISNTDVGTANFHFCLFFNGPSYNIDYWYIDDIRLGVALQRDAALHKLNVPSYGLGDNDVKGVVVNMGSSTLTSLDATWQTDNGDLHTDTFNGLNLTLGQSSEIVFNDVLSLDPGNHPLKVWIDNVNALGPDQDNTNDTLDKTLHVASQSVARRPFFEEFTSSTCNPCASFNSGTFNPFIATYGDQITLIKYQMNWPGSGDPYYTEEGGVRRYFYGVGFVPDLYVDGVQVPTTSAGVNTGFNSSLATPAFMDAQNWHYIEGNSVVGQVNILPHISGDLTAYVAIVERVTTGNVSTNGETEFHNVMMKMYPDAYGSPISLVDGQMTSFDYNVDMSGTNVEQMNDLLVVFWVQDGSTRELFQSSYSDSTMVGVPEQFRHNVSVWPNPTSGQISFSGIEPIQKVDVYNSMGDLVMDQTFVSSRRMDLSTLPAGFYLLKIRTDHEISTARVNVVH